MFSDVEVTNVTNLKETYEREKPGINAIIHDRLINLNKVSIPITMHLNPNTANMVSCRWYTGWPKKNNTETNQYDTDTNDIFGKSLMHNYL